MVSNQSCKSLSRTRIAYNTKQNKIKSKCFIYSNFVFYSTIFNCNDLNSCTRQKQQYYIQLIYRFDRSHRSVLRTRRTNRLFCSGTTEVATIKILGRLQRFDYNYLSLSWIILEHSVDSGQSSAQFDSFTKEVERKVEVRLGFCFIHGRLDVSARLVYSYRSYFVITVQLQ